MLRGSGIRENFIEVKSTAEQHDEETFRKCRDIILDVTSGKVAVLCDKHITKVGMIEVAYGIFKGSMDSDSGTVLHSRYKHLKAGDRVGFLPMHGIRCNPETNSWAPEGCEIRIYGMACDIEYSLVRLDSGQVFPLGDMLMTKNEVKRATDSGIHLPASMVKNERAGKIVHSTEDYTEGDMVLGTPGSFEVSLDGTLFTVFDKHHSAIVSA